MIIPSDREALDYAAIGGKDGTPITMQLADMEANRVMKDWMKIPENLHEISQEFENNSEKLKQLLQGAYKVQQSEIPTDIMDPVIKAFRVKTINQKTKTDLSMAMHDDFTFEEFNRARKNVTKYKSPGPSRVTNNQIKSWSV